MAEANKHAKLSPSSASRWLRCPASVLLSQGLPDESSPYAEEGSKAHRLAELTLQVKWALTSEAEAAEEMAAIRAELPEAEQHVARYVQVIDEIMASGDVLYKAVEMRLSLSSITGEDESYGTADCVVVTKRSDDYELHIVDFKYGMGVPVSAAENEQLGIYALAALAELDPEEFLFGISRVFLHIVQPRIENISEWEVSRAALAKNFLGCVQRAADRAMHLLEHPEDLKEAWPFVPVVDKRVTYDETKRTGEVMNIVVEPRGDFSSPAEAEKVCKWCKAKATCPVLRKQMADTLAQDFEDLSPAPIEPEVKAELKEIPLPDSPERLAAAFRYLSMIRDWCDAVEDSTRKRLQVGEQLPGLKLVAGRQGPRKWSDAKEAEEILLRALRVSSVYDRKVISPTTAEKLMKEGLIGPRYWTKLSALISRSDGKPAIVPADDPREAIVPQLENDFD